jgi:hypothetical protein
MKSTIVCPTESIVDIYDKNILWYKIKDFPGYEISNPNNFVRSFNSAHKYPYGVILNYYHSDGNYYEMICYDNNIHQLSIDTIWDLCVDKLDNPVYGYQVETKETD